MPLALLANLPWKWIGIVLAVLAALWFVDHRATLQERHKWETALSAQKEEAAAKLAAAEARNRAKESEWYVNQKAANDRHQDDQIAISAAADRYRGVVAQLLRERAGCRPSGGDQVSDNPAGPKVGDRSDTGQPDVLSGPIASRLEARYREADATLARLRECRAERMGLMP